MLEVPSSGLNARLKSVRELMDGVSDLLLRDVAPGPLQCFLQFGNARIALLSHLLLEDRPDRVVERVQVGTRAKKIRQTPKMAENDQTQ